MTDPLHELIVAIGAFVLWHMVASSPGIRNRITGAVGEGGFLGLFSVVAAALLIWAVIAFRAAPETLLWPSLTGFRHLAGGGVLIACILVFAGFTIRNPTSVGADTPDGKTEPIPGIIKITRHPAMWGAGIWAVMHVIANGDSASAVFFGGFAILAFVGPVLIDRKKRLAMGESWEEFARQTSNLPFAALAAGRTRVTLAEIGYARMAGGVVLYLLLLLLHEPLFGIWPLWIG